MKKSCSGIELPKNIDSSWLIGIVHSSFYMEEVGKLIMSAKETLIEAGISEGNISVHPVTGTYEIPLVGAALADAGNVDALIGFGIVVQGETYHAQAVVREASRGMMDVQTRYKIPFAFEVLHVDSLKDAHKRLEGRGREAALAVLHSLVQIHAVADQNAV